ncbi:MAG: TolC family protein [Bryobacteraceae bacterium]
MRTFLLSLALAGALLAQDVSNTPPAKASYAAPANTPKAVDYDPWFPKPSYFRKRFTPIPTRVELQPPTRLSDFVVEGKLELSLRSALDLALANNPDISIQVLAIEIPKDSILRAYSVFDPLAIASFNPTRTQTPTSDSLAGAAVLSSLSQPLNLQYSQLLSTGTQLNVNYNGLKTSNNNSFQFFNPTITSRFNVNLSQPLLKNRGSYIAKLPVTIARSRLRQAQFPMEDSVMQLIAVAENAYWNVIGARENLRVSEETLKLANEALKRAQRELELGASSPLDIFQPQANYANAEISLTQARFSLAQTEDALRRQIGADRDPQVRMLPMSLTESVSPPVSLADMDREALVAKALSRRSDLKASSQSLDIDELNLKLTTNNLRPDVSLTANYGTYGRGGNQLTSGGVLPGGIADALNQTFAFTYPSYGVGITLRIPVRDRNAAANYADAVVQRRLDQLAIQSAQSNIRLQVLTAINQIENSKASVELAKVARDLAQKRLDAEQKKYELGTTTIFFVISAQGDLANAEAALVREAVNYRRNQLTLLQRSGTLLDERGITLN